MKKLTVFLLCLLCSPAIGGMLGFELHENSILALDDTLKVENWFKFKGQIEISGRYEFMYDENSPHENLTALYFYPDAESAQLLPYMKEDGRIYKTNEMFIKNVRIAAEPLLGKPSSEKFFTGKKPVFTGQETIIVGQFEAGYESDSILFIGDFIKEVVP